MNENNFLALPDRVDPKALRSPGLRLVTIPGDVLAPTLREGDCVLCAPAYEFGIDGLYAYDTGHGIDVWRFQSNFAGGIRMFGDNPAYDAQIITHEQFTSIVLGFVVAEIRVTSPSVIREIHEVRS